LRKYIIILSQTKRWRGVGTIYQKK